MMILALFAFLVSSTVPSLSFPIDSFGPTDILSSDYLDYYGPYSSDVYLRGFGLERGLGGWPFNRYGSLWSNDYIDPLNPTALGLDSFNRYPYYPYSYDSPRSSVDYAKENFVRGDIFGSTEVGTRDEVTVRNGGYLRYPYYRYNPFNNPFNLLRNTRNPYAITDLDYRRPFPFGASTSKASVVSRIADPDGLFLRR